ncbi:Post-GPI attachment to proteins factor 3 [Schistosoma japonicum]|nr:Post-GPI attachment to proteins factor 3 [Schistosoma japonicum]
MAAIYFKVVLTYVCGLLFVIPPVITSIGDQAYVFYKCNQKCIEGICESSPNKRSCWDKHFNSSSVVMFEHTILWDCKSECRYRCMWNTVSAFEKDGLPVPQFNGKWPFVRLCGMQEPASVLFSLLNLVFICYMFSQFYKYVPFNSPMYKTWVVQTVFSMNAWVWSIIFHSRDTSFTEV